MYVRTHVLKIINMRNWLQSIEAKNMLRQKNHAKKNLEKYRSLSKTISSLVRLLIFAPPILQSALLLTSFNGGLMMWLCCALDVSSGSVLEVLL